MAISRKNWSPTNYTRVCSDHFVDGIGPERKHNDKIPTEYLAQQLQGGNPQWIGAPSLVIPSQMLT